MAEKFGFIEERLSGTEDLRGVGATAYPLRRLYERLRAYLHLQRPAFMVSRALWGVTALLFTIGSIIAFILIAYLYTHNAMTIGTAYLVFTYTQQLVQPRGQISGQLDDFQQASASAIRMLELLDTQPAIVDGPGAPLPVGALAVSFDGVRFGYRADQPVLHDLSSTLAPSRVLGVLGRTGSGKSTLTRLLFRLYDPDAGAIRLGGVDLRDATLDELRSRVGLVTQEVQLFQATVRDNLRFYNPTISDARILAALDDLGLSSWYATLPRGLDTELAGAGAGLSAGQAQLLALIRAFLSDPSLVILDEASSRLDPATERHIERAMDRLLRERTAIIGTGLILLVAAEAMRGGRFTVGDFALFVFNLSSVTGIISFVGTMLVRYKQAGIAHTRMIALLQGAPAARLVEYGPVYLRGAIPDLPRVARTEADHLIGLEAHGISYHYPDTGGASRGSTCVWSAARSQ